MLKPRVRRTIRGGVVVASLSLVLGACGGGGASSAPEDAKEDDFCETYNSLINEILADVDAEADDEEQAKTIVTGLKTWSEAMLETGTPEDISDDAREGFVLSMESIEELDADASQEDFESLGDDFSAEETDLGTAFSTYATETCGGPIGGSGLEVPAPE